MKLKYIYGVLIVYFISISTVFSESYRSRDNKGFAESRKDYDYYLISSNSIVGKKGTLSVISGGKIISIYHKVKIICVYEDSNAVLIETIDRERIYIKAEIIFEIDK